MEAYRSCVSLLLYSCTRSLPASGPSRRTSTIIEVRSFEIAGDAHSGQHVVSATAAQLHHIARPVNNGQSLSRPDPAYLTVRT